MVSVSIHRTQPVAASADSVWERMRVFGGLDSWALDIAGPIEVIGDPEVVGAERLFRADGVVVNVERLFAFDDTARSLSYGIISPDAALREHVAIHRVEDNGDASVAVWETTFEVDDALADQLTESLIGIYDRALAELARQAEESEAAR